MTWIEILIALMPFVSLAIGARMNPSQEEQ